MAGVVPLPTEFGNDQSRAAVLQALLNVACSGNPPKIHEGEAFLLAAGAVPGFASVLGDFLLSAEIPTPARQLAGLTLRKVVKEQWDETVEEKERSYIRGQLPKAFFLTDTKLTTAAALVVGAIANIDFPDEWPNLVSDLVQLVSPSQPIPVVTAAVKCLKIISEDLCENTLAQFASQALGPMGLLFSNPAPENLRRCVLQTAANLVQTATEMEVMPLPLSQALPGLVAICNQQLRDCTHPSLQCAALSFLNIVVYSYNKLLGDALVDLAALLCNSLGGIVNSAKEMDDGYTSEGDCVGQEAVMLGHLELLNTFTKKKLPRKALEKALGLGTKDGFTLLHQLLVRCSWVTEDSYAEYMEDQGKYLQDEELMEETYLCTIRDVAKNVIENLHQHFKLASVGCLLHVCEGQFQGDWRAKEAALFAMYTVLPMRRLLRQAGFQMATLHSGVLSLLSTASEPFLVARCLWLLAKSIEATSMKAPVLPSPEAVQEVVKRITDPMSIPMVRIQGVKCFSQYYLKSPDKKAVESECTAVLRVMCQIIHGAVDGGMTGDVLNAHLDECAFLLKLNPAVDVQTLPQDAILLWQKYFTDPFLVESVVDLYGVLSGVPSAEASIETCALPTLFNAMRNHTQLPPGTLENAVTLLGSIAKASTKLLQTLVAQGLPIIAGVTLQSEDQKVAGAVALCLTTIVKRLGGETMASVMVQAPPPMANAGQPVSALDLALEVIAHPAVNEAALSNTGRLILQLFADATAQLGSDRIGLLLNLVLQRVLVASSTAVIQELLLPIAAMACKFPDQLLAYLSQPVSALPNAPSKLQALTEVWLREQPRFWGASQELRLLCAGFLSIAPHAAGFQVTLTAAEDSKKKRKALESERVDASLAMFVGVSRGLASVLENKTEDEEDEGFGEEDEEDEEASAEEGKDDDDDDDAGSDSEDEYDFTISSALVKELCGTEEVVIAQAKSWLQGLIATFAGKAMPFLTSTEQAVLSREFRH